MSYRVHRWWDSKDMDCSRLLEGSCREESEENLKGADQNAEVQT